VFVEDGDIAKTSITVLYELMEARDVALRSGRERGMEADYNRLEEMLSSMPAVNR
jgi:hypothetical protein